MVWLRQNAGEGRIVIAAQNAKPDGTMLRNVTFYRIDADGGMVDRLDAPTATLGDGRWTLERAVRTEAGRVPEAVGTIAVETRVLPETVAQRTTAPEATSFLALFERVAAMRRLGLPTAPFTMQVHALLTRPVLFVGMTLIAGTVCLRFARFGQARTVVLGGLAAAFVLYVATVLVRAFGTSGLVAPFVAAWIPVLAALFIGAAVLLRTEDG